MKAIIIASVGESHPLYNIPFEAEITPCTGYDTYQVRATGVGRYFVPENPNGIFRFKNGEIVGVSPSPARVDTFDGYAEKIFVENVGRWVTAREYSTAVKAKQMLAKLENNEDFALLIDAVE